jgi:hypothetical protein
VAPEEAAAFAKEGASKEGKSEHVKQDIIKYVLNQAGSFLQDLEDIDAGKMTSVYEAGGVSYLINNGLVEDVDGKATLTSLGKEVFDKVEEEYKKIKPAEPPKEMKAPKEKPNKAFGWYKSLINQDDTVKETTLSSYGMQLVSKDKWPEQIILSSTSKKYIVPKEAVYAVFTYEKCQWALTPKYYVTEGKFSGAPEWETIELSTGKMGTHGGSIVYCLENLIGHKDDIAHAVKEGLSETKDWPVEKELKFDSSHVKNPGAEPKKKTADQPKGKHYTPKAIEYGGITWEPKFLKAVDEWCGSHSFCKSIRDHITQEIDNLPLPKEHNEKDLDKYLAHDMHVTMNDLKEFAKDFDSHTTDIKDKELYRGTANGMWLSCEPGDFVPFGIGSVSRSSSKAFEFGTIHLKIVPPPKGKLRGVDIHGLEDEATGNSDVKDWLDHTENARRYTYEAEVALRCKALKVVKKEQKGLRYTITVEACDDIPKGVVMKSVQPTMWWSLYGDIGGFAESRKKGKLQKARGKLEPIGTIRVVHFGGRRVLRQKTAMGWKWLPSKVDRIEGEHIQRERVKREPTMVRKVLVLKQGKRKGQEVVRYVKKPRPRTYYSPMSIKRAGMRLAGWTDMSHSPTPKQWEVMKKLGTAVIRKGTPEKGLQWHARENSLNIPWKPEARHIECDLWQYRPVKDRVSAVAVMHMTIDYPYARQFIELWITSTERRNKYLGELERSAGYQEFKRSQIAEGIPAENKPASQRVLAMWEGSAEFYVVKHWLSGPKKGMRTEEKSIEKPRIGSVHVGAWGGKYKVVQVRPIEEKPDV